MIIIFIFILLFLFFIYIIIYKTKFRYDYISLNDAYNDIKTGDVLYFITHKYYNIPIFLKPIIAHLGMIIEINKEKYVIELHAEGDIKNIGVNKNGGVNIYPFKQRVKSYTIGNVYLAKLSNEKKPSTKSINQFINNIEYYRKNIPFNKNYKKYGFKNCLLHRVCKNCFTLEKTPSMFCSEFVAFCLKELNIIDSYKCTLPDEFIFLKDSSKNIYLYNKFYQIKNKI